MKFKSSPEKFSKFLFIAIPFLFLFSGVFSLYEQLWLDAFLAFLGFFLCLLPSRFDKYGIKASNGLKLFILLFILASIYLGEKQSFYFKFWWWDMMLHTLAGMVFGLFAFNIFYLINSEDSLDFKLNPTFLMIFSISFALSLGVFWEFFEFTIDQTFGTNMQKSGLVDTMFDLMLTFIGATIVNLFVFFYLLKNKIKFRSFFKNFIKIKNKK
jgi:hypothetical protein